jgi:hypothetical protein
VFFEPGSLKNPRALRSRKDADGSSE